jgi:hypothetical protein
MAKMKVDKGVNFADFAEELSKTDKEKVRD